MFDALSDRLRRTLGSLTGRGRVSEADVDAAMREVRLALLEADVNFKVVKDFTARVRERAVGAEVLESLNAGQQVVKIVHEELTALLSAGDRTFHLSGSPAVVALVGPAGLRQDDLGGQARPPRRQARPAARSSSPPTRTARPPSTSSGPSAGASTSRSSPRPPGTPVPEIGRLALDAARREVRDTVILDTAGRLTVDEVLMAEIAELNRVVRPVETLLVVDAMVGQEAVAVAQAFAAAVPVTGLVLTKIDGDARGGAALSISAVTGLPVKFLGTGEKTDALEPFHPDRLAGRILGMGDVLTLVERAQEAFDAEAGGEGRGQDRGPAPSRLEDMLEQLQQVKKMGPLGQVVEMIPGLGGMAQQAQESVDRGDLKRTEAIIRSMTPLERRDPDVLNASRRRRIAAGSGTSIAEVNRLVKQFSEMQKLMKQLRGGRRIPGMFGR